MRGIRLQQGDPARQVVGKIARAHLGGWWLVEDARGRVYRAASSESWRKGDQVVIMGDQILGRAGKVKTPVVYEV